MFSSQQFDFSNKANDFFLYKEKAQKNNVWTVNDVLGVWFRASHKPATSLTVHML